MSRNFLEINHMKKSFGELEVIKDISLTVKEGEVVSIIGPSGSGKSTLLLSLIHILRNEPGAGRLCQSYGNIRHMTDKALENSTGILNAVMELLRYIDDTRRAFPVKAGTLYNAFTVDSLEGAKENFEMKKIGLGIAILLFALVFSCCSSGMEWLTLIIGMIGLVFSVIGFMDKKS